jgi:beta-galactosidase
MTCARRRSVIRVLCLAAAALAVCARSAAEPGVREHLLLDDNWRFAFGHPFDTAKDFGHATGYFSYFAKAGYGDGPAAAGFDDRAWRVLSLPHDWAVEMPFDPKAGYSHGYRAVGRDFPDTSVGWYRRRIPIAASDLGRRISVQFDGVFRDSEVWINGYYLGRETSGYSGFRYDLTDYLRYGGDNVIAVRVNATMEEGWFYEGAGIYRHVWLDKTASLHVAPDGVFATSELKADAAEVNARAVVANDGTAPASIDIEQELIAADGRRVAFAAVPNLEVAAGSEGEFSAILTVPHPRLWSLEDPCLHTLVTTVRSGGSIVDRCETTVGIRTVRFDPNLGFFLNGVRVELKGTNEHQDFAGVGVAVPDAIQSYRVARLKSMGSNAVRCAHNIPAPAFLEACDRLGMLVVDENRRMGVTPEILGEFRRMILRDRNHPSVILWSMGNEEWSMEGNITGARVASAMQAFGRRLDPSRSFTAAVSGGWEGGIGTVTDVMGYNYIIQGDIDRHHAIFPLQSGVGTEETTTRQTRGVYFNDLPRGHLGQTYRNGAWGCEAGWRFYAARPFLAGLFFWTGFDYAGEPEPTGWPQVGSQSGILDSCGFPKDSYFYLKSCWTAEPVVHLLPHWNWAGREGLTIPVKAYGNCDEVELFLNGASLGRKAMAQYGSLEWNVAYQPGTLLARGYRAGREAASDKVETTGVPAAIALSSDRAGLEADGRDAALVQVRVDDGMGRTVPTAQTLVSFSIDGPGRIIAVGNGDPASHEPDKYLPTVRTMRIRDWRLHEFALAADPAMVAAVCNDSAWRSVFSGLDQAYPSRPAVYRGRFEADPTGEGEAFLLFLPALGEREAVFLNGRQVGGELAGARVLSGIPVEPGMLAKGANLIAVVAQPLRLAPRSFDYTSPGVLQVASPAADWKRRAFNGLAAVIIQSTGGPGRVTLTATAPGLTRSSLTFATR